MTAPRRAQCPRGISKVGLGFWYNATHNFQLDSWTAATSIELRRFDDLARAANSRADRGDLVCGLARGRDRVTWYNADTIQHAVTTNGTGALELDSPLLNPGDTWSHTFTQPGTYLYHCTPHPLSMWRKVVVTP